MTPEEIKFEQEFGGPAQDEPALVVDVEGFEGPLDLLLVLARQPVSIGELLSFTQVPEIARPVMFHLLWRGLLVFILAFPSYVGKADGKPYGDSQADRGECSSSLRAMISSASVNTSRKIALARSMRTFQASAPLRPA